MCLESEKRESDIEPRDPEVPIAFCRPPFVNNE